MRPSPVAILFIMSLLVSSLAAHAETAACPADGIGRTMSSIIAADNRGDLAAVIDQYTDDAALWSPQKIVISGKGAIRKNYAQTFKAVRLHIVSHIAETFVEGNSATVLGNNEVEAISKKDGSRQESGGAFMALLRCEPDGKWRILRLIWTG